MLEEEWAPLCVRAVCALGLGGGGDYGTGCTALEECVQPGGTPVKLIPPWSAPLSLLPLSICQSPLFCPPSLHKAAVTQADRGRLESLDGEKSEEGRMKEGSDEERASGIWDIIKRSERLPSREE